MVILQHIVESELKYSYKTTLVLLDLNFGKDRIYGVEIYALRTEELEIYAQGHRSGLQVSALARLEGAGVIYQPPVRSLH
jgi:hypothetical protein